MIEKNQIYDIEIVDISADGNGIGKIENFAVFVANSAIGDILKIKIVKVLSSYGFGIIQEIIKPSKDRIEPDCSVFNRCGGCDFRHISYDAELKIKQKTVENSFLRLHKIDVKINEIVGSDEQNRYRNKAQIPVSIDKNNNLLAGFYARRSHNLVTFDDCKIQSEQFNEIIADVVEFAKMAGLNEINKSTNTTILRHIYLRHAKSTDEIMLCLVMTDKKLLNQTQLIEKIVTKHKNIVSILINENKNSTNVILGKKNYTIFGKDTIIDILCSISIELSPHSFYQINKPQTQKLYQIAAELAQPNDNDILLDLYCGAGTIGLSMACKVKKLVGIEITPQAIENAKQNAINNKITNADFFCTDAKNTNEILSKNKINPTIVVIDPPRKGCDQQVIDTIVSINPKKIVMISCNPSTAARDCLLLEKNGFKTKTVTPVDMFPRTANVECVVLMERV